MSLGLLPSTRRRTVAPPDLAAMLADPDNPVTAALRCLHGNCFVADATLRLIWMNDDARLTMTTLAPQLNKSY